MPGPCHTVRVALGGARLHPRVLARTALRFQAESGPNGAALGRFAATTGGGDTSAEDSRRRFLLPAATLLVAGAAVGAVTFTPGLRTNLAATPALSCLSQGPALTAVLRPKTLPGPEPPVFVDPGDCVAQLQKQIDCPHFLPVIVRGGFGAGKRSLVRKALGERRGVVHVSVTNDKASAYDLLTASLGATIESQVEDAFRQANDLLGETPIVVFDVPYEVKAREVLGNIQGFAYNWGYKQHLCRVVVVACTSAAEQIRDYPFTLVYVQPLSKAEFDHPQMSDFLRHHGGPEAVNRKREIYELAGGNIGRVEVLLMRAKELGWEPALAELRGSLEDQAGALLNIDRNGGFFPPPPPTPRPSYPSSLSQRTAQLREHFQRAAKRGNAAALARAVASAPFEEGVDVSVFRDRFCPQDFEWAAQAARLWAVEYDRQASRYRAASLEAHAMLRKAVF